MLGTWQLLVQEKTSQKCTRPERQSLCILYRVAKYSSAYWSTNILICMQWWHSDARETITEIVLLWVVETRFCGRVQRDLTVDTSTEKFDVFFRIIAQLYYLSLWGVLFWSAQTSFTCCWQMQFEIAFGCRPGFRSCSRRVSASLLVSVSILIGWVGQPNPSSYQICGFRSDLSLLFMFCPDWPWGFVSPVQRNETGSGLSAC